MYTVLPTPLSGHLGALGGHLASCVWLLLGVEGQWETGAVPRLLEDGVSLPGGSQAWGGSSAPPLGISGWLHLVGWLPGTANPARRWAHARGWGPAEAVLTPAASLRELEGDRVPLRLAGHRLTHCPPSSFVPEDLRPCLAKNVMTEEIKILYSLSVPFLK